MQLALEEIAVLDLLIDGKDARERVPIVFRELVHCPQKYAFPIGLDEEGRPFTIPTS